MANPYKQPLKHKIQGFMRGRDWTPLGRIELQASEWYTTGSTIGRRCRELVKEGKLEVRSTGKFVSYKLIPTVVHDGYKWGPEIRPQGTWNKIKEL